MRPVSFVLLIVLVVLAATGCSTDGPPAARAVVTAAPAIPTAGIAMPPPARGAGMADGSPSLSISPSEGDTGQQLRVIGKGFSPGSDVRLVLGLPQSQARGTDLARTSANEKGEIEATFTVPADAQSNAGNLIIYATDQSGTAVTAIAVFFVRDGGQPAVKDRTAPGVVVTGDVGDVDTSSHVINLTGQVHGFSTVAVGRDAAITSADGTARTLQDIKPGAVIQLSGHDIGAGVILADKIRIVSGT